MNRKRKLNLPGWLFIAAVVVYDELLLHIWTAGGIVPGRLLAVVLFAMAFGGVLGFVTSLLPPKGQKWCAIILALILAVVYLLEYFLSDAYQVFMPFETVFDGADGVAEDYLDLVMSLLARNFWRIGLVILPAVLYALFARCRKSRWQTRACLGAGAAALYLLGFCAVHWVGIDEAKLTTAYNFDSAVRAFGLHAGLTLDITRGSAETETEQDFVIPEQPTQAATEPPAEPGPAETEQTPEPTVVYGDNAFDLDFAALAEAETRSSISKLHSYVAGQTPSKQNEFTGLFEGKNLIFITAEAFCAEVIDPAQTPTLYRLANQGIRFTDYYQPLWGGSTSTGEYSNITGLVAANGSYSMKESTQQDLFLTIGNQLQALGYHSAAYHNHTYTYYDRNLTHTGMGYDTFMGMGNGMEEGVEKQWPQSDLEMMEFTLEQYIDQQPFSVYYMTVSGHCLYNTGGNAMSRKNYDAVAELDCSETLKCYFAAQLELEHALEYLVGRLEEAGIADDTVIVLATDHYPYGLEKSSTWLNTKDYLSELYGYTYADSFGRDHSALIIWSGCLEGRDIVVDTPVYSLDILPTLSNLFGVAYDSRLLVGRDVFSDAQPLALWPQYHWKTDKGSYDASTGTFTPAEGVEVEEGYVEYICAIVKNKITYSHSAAKQDYFDIVKDLLEKAAA